MIKLQNLNKYYNRNKNNEIHVINNINLELPSSGLVVLLGPSGSGKTTLLNVLGGLDKVQSGAINFGDAEINHYSSRVWDQIRNRKVGYIFQNYNLLTNLTVYDNISLTLNMIGIYDKDEIDRRIDYILDSMGMINYRKRRASQLSGGQQQRVAIARALAKNPSVIIADEPTGNLDSKNTQEIMNIIKAISVNKLVVLVTHEEEIANFYGDRIIRLKDGQIVSDESNRSNGTLDMRHDTDIYLKDLRAVSSLLNQNTKVSLYSDEDIDDQVEVRLIVKNKTLYIDVKSNEYQKMQLVEQDSEIKILDKKYEKTSRETIEIKEFNLENVIKNEVTDHTKHSVISIKDSLRLAFKRIKDSSNLGKLFYFGFAAIAALVALAVGLGNSYVTIDADQFLYDSKYLVNMDKGDATYAELLALQSDPSIDYLRYVDNIYINVYLPTVFQAWSNQADLNGTPESAEYMKDRDLIKGRGVESPNEFVIDKRLADSMINNSSYRYLGITSYDDIFELEFDVQLPGSSGNYVVKLTLVGIVDTDSPMIYMDQDVIFMKAYQVGIYEFFEDDITITEGVTVATNSDIIIRDTATLNSPLNLNKITYFDKEFTAVGTFTADEVTPMVLVKRSAINEAYFLKGHQSSGSTVDIIANNVDDAMDFLSSEGFTPESYFAVNSVNFRADRIAQGIGTITFILVVIAASAISYFFVIRSSLLSRIYEVSVYRALGVTKLDIHKIFTTETLLVTTITSMIGYALATMLLWRLQLLVEDFTDIIKVTPFSIVAGILIIYVVNLVSGLIPVTNLLRKTPAEILSKYDF